MIEANPSAAELMYKKYLENKEKIKEDKKQAILDKYGGVEHLEAPPQELLLNQSGTGEGEGFVSGSCGFYVLRVFLWEIFLDLFV